MAFSAPLGPALRDLVVDELVVRVRCAVLCRAGGIAEVLRGCRGRAQGRRLLGGRLMCLRICVWRPLHHPPIPIAPPRPVVCEQVVLPEGARDPQVSSEVRLAGPPEHETKVTYLDVMGRPVVVLRARNVVPDMSQPFTVSRGLRCAALGAPVSGDGHTEAEATSLCSLRLPSPRPLPPNAGHLLLLLPRPAPETAAAGGRWARGRQIRPRHSLHLLPCGNQLLLSLTPDYTSLPPCAGIGSVFAVAMALNRGSKLASSPSSASLASKAHAS